MAMSWVLAVCLLCVLIDVGRTIKCPTGYVFMTGGGCYKIINGTVKTWEEARAYCLNDTLVLFNETEPNSVTHLVALEHVIEKNSLFYWMTAYQLYSQFWMDGMLAEGAWNWSGQAITWFFEAEKRAVVGNGSYYKLAYSSNATTFQIADDSSTAQHYFICEYQIPCNTSACQPNGKCFLNLGDELCLCNPGFTGENCSIELDECLSAPCLHGGQCVDAVNNYTCNCSSIFYTGRNCEIPIADPTHNQRTAAFWAVLGVIIGMVAMLTFSDLPWTDILVSVGCEKYCLKCRKGASSDGYSREYDSQSSSSPSGGFYGATDSKMSHHGLEIRNTVWTPDYATNPTPRNVQYNGYRSPEQNADVQRATLNESDERRVYAVDIDKSASTGADHADTMVSWTQQLQQQLRNKQPREASAGSTKQLVHASRASED